MVTRIRLLLFFLLVVGVGLSAASRGDRDYTFHTCMKSCRDNKCQGDAYLGQGRLLSLLYWGCEDECRYGCMWGTVEALAAVGVPTPQFFGKWPFLRVLGMQEPASVLFSLLNFFAHFWGILSLWRNVPSCRLIWLWTAFALVCMNGWVWSMAFHTRDYPFTELMDYLSAFSMNAFSFFSIFVRLGRGSLSLGVVTMAGLILSFSAYHFHYLVYVHFDYGYNMKANLAMGVLNAACWLLWSGLNRKTHPHVWKCAVFVLLAVASLGLEVLDFPPLWWVIDAHALWHAITAPITLLWYSFLLDDCQFLLEPEEGKKLI